MACGWMQSPPCCTWISRENEGQWTPNVHGGRENLEAIAFLQEVNATAYRRAPGHHHDRGRAERLAGVSRDRCIGAGSGSGSS